MRVEASDFTVGAVLDRAASRLEEAHLDLLRAAVTTRGEGGAGGAIELAAAHVLELAGQLRIVIDQPSPGTPSLRGTLETFHRRREASSQELASLSGAGITPATRAGEIVAEVGRALDELLEATFEEDPS